ncbi:type II toxin-antitoxin system RelE/ParE family toxin [Novosphingobium aquae]|uniref:Type II toxin-antitoxin system RelE/ParE family toxin n=1 Tax=Novosphingobium aquae TaxID=3133435 RepID=A0ABU8SCH5_9SPHN
MEIDSIRHKALKRLFLEGKSKGIIEPERLIDLLAFIVAAANFDRLGGPPNFGFHALSGERKGSFAMTVMRNWRLTFCRIDDQTLADLDLEDYH